jgi:outer membrane protein assembly factor BamB
MSGPARLVCATVLVFSGAAYACDVPLSVIDGVYTPMDEHPTVELVSMDVRIFLGPDDAAITCKTTFHNTGDAATVLMGFLEERPPQPGGDRGFSYYTTRVDGKNVTTESTPWQPADTGGESRWNTKEVRFDRDQTVLVESRCDVPVLRDPEGNRSFTYDTTPARHWHGMVGQIDVRVETTALSHSTLTMTPTPHQVYGNWSTWAFYDTKPDQTIRIGSHGGIFTFVVDGKERHVRIGHGPSSPHIEDGVLMATTSLLHQLLVFRGFDSSISRSVDTLTMSYDEKALEVKDGSAQASLDGKAYTLPCPARRLIVDGGIYFLVPMRSVLEAFGIAVEFDKETFTVYVKLPTDPYGHREPPPTLREREPPQGGAEGLRLALSAWPKFHGNAENTGRGLAGGAQGVLKWEVRTAGIAISSSPAVGVDEIVYVGSWDKKVYAIDGASGEKLWAYSTGGSVFSTPAVASDGTVYVGSDDGYLYALNGRTGARKWSVYTGKDIMSSPTIGPDGTVYVGSDSWRLYALDGGTGAKKWAVDTDGCIQSCPALARDGTVYFGTSGGKLHAVEGATGKPKWEFTAGAEVRSSPALGGNGLVYVGSRDNKLYALDAATGAKRWEFDAGDEVQSSPAVAADGTVYVASRDGKVCALDGETGTPEWQFAAGGKVFSSPAIGSDGTVYIGSSDSKLYALDGATGVKKWEFVTGGYVSSSPAIGLDGTIYFGSGDGKVYALR